MKDIIIPIFPLNGVIFFPDSVLPLNIFEDRYIGMIDHCLKSNRLIGMIQSKKKGSLYSVGCVGKINSFSEIKEGGYVINLVGKNFFYIKNQIRDSNKFISANVKLVPLKKQFTKITLQDFNKKILIEKYKKYIEDENIKIDFTIFDRVSDEEIIKFISMSCAFSPEDKQMLLETFDIAELGNKLISLFDFYPIKTKNKFVN